MRVTSSWPLCLGGVLQWWWCLLMDVPAFRASAMLLLLLPGANAVLNNPNGNARGDGQGLSFNLNALQADDSSFDASLDRYRSNLRRHLDTNANRGTADLKDRLNAFHGNENQNADNRPIFNNNDRNNNDVRRRSSIAETDLRPFSGLLQSLAQPSDADADINNKDNNIGRSSISENDMKPFRGLLASLDQPNNNSGGTDRGGGLSSSPRGGDGLPFSGSSSGPRGEDDHPFSGLMATLGQPTKASSATSTSTAGNSIFRGNIDLITDPFSHPNLPFQGLMASLGDSTTTNTTTTANNNDNNLGRFTRHQSSNKPFGGLLATLGHRDSIYDGNNNNNNNYTTASTTTTNNTNTTGPGTAAQRNISPFHGYPRSSPHNYNDINDVTVLTTGSVLPAGDIEDHYDNGLMAALERPGNSNFGPSKHPPADTSNAFDGFQTSVPQPNYANNNNNFGQFTNPRTNTDNSVNGVPRLLPQPNSNLGQAAGSQTNTASAFKGLLPQPKNNLGQAADSQTNTASAYNGLPPRLNNNLGQAADSQTNTASAYNGLPPRLNNNLGQAADSQTNTAGAFKGSLPQPNNNNANDNFGQFSNPPHHSNTGNYFNGFSTEPNNYRSDSGRTADYRPNTADALSEMHNAPPSQLNAADNIGRFTRPETNVGEASSGRSPTTAAQPTSYNTSNGPTPSFPSNSGAPYNGLNSGAPYNGLNSGAPYNGLNSGAPYNGLNSGAPYNGLNSGAPYNGLNSGAPYNGLNSGAPYNGLNSGAPYNGLNSGAPYNGLNSGAPYNGLNSGAPYNGLNSGAPYNGLNSGAPYNGLNSGAPYNGLNSGAPSNGLNSGAPSNGLNSGAPYNGLNSGTPYNGIPTPVSQHNSQDVTNQNDVSGRSAVTPSNVANTFNGLPTPFSQPNNANANTYNNNFGRTAADSPSNTANTFNGLPTPFSPPNNFNVNDNYNANVDNSIHAGNNSDNDDDNNNNKGGSADPERRLSSTRQTGPSFADPNNNSNSPNPNNIYNPSSNNNNNYNLYNPYTIHNPNSIPGVYPANGYDPNNNNNNNFGRRTGTETNATTNPSNELLTASSGSQPGNNFANNNVHNKFGGSDAGAGSNPFSGFQASLAHRKNVYATCNVTPDPESPFNVTGTVDFAQGLTTLNYPMDQLDIRVRLQGFPSDDRTLQHGLHVHQWGDLRGGCGTSGPHFNPVKAVHGARTSPVRHVGDLGNVQEDDQGRVVAAFKDKVASLAGDHSIVGRALVIHESPDDLGMGGNKASLESGNAGRRVACCTIGFAAPFINWPV